jgi:type IV pilus assembly protein PilA
MSFNSSLPQSGFSLIELLVVIAIISALTAIAVPQYAEYRAKAFDLRALEDLRNVAIAEEAYFADSERYLACSNLECATTLPGIARISAGVVLTIETSEESFTGTSSHPKGSGKTFRWESAEGGLVE